MRLSLYGEALRLGRVASWQNSCHTSPKPMRCSLSWSSRRLARAHASAQTVKHFCCWLRTGASGTRFWSVAGSQP